MIALSHIESIVRRIRASLFDEREREKEKVKEEREKKTKKNQLRSTNTQFSDA